MRVTKYIWVVAIVLLFGCSPDDSDSPNPEDVFTKYFGVSASQTGVDLIYNENLNQYFILGSQTPSGGDTDFYFVIANEAGNFIDEDTTGFKFPSGINGNDIPTSIKQMDDGSNRYLVIGTSSNDDQSKIVWGIVSHDLSSQNFFEITNPNQDLIGADIVKIPGEDNVLIFGTTSTVYPGDQVTGAAGTQLFISKRSITTNDPIWTRSSGSAGDDIALSAFSLDNGGFALFGSTERDEDSHTGTNVLVKFTSDRGVEDGVDAAYGFDSAPSNDNVPKDVIKVGFNYLITGTSSQNGSNPNAFVFGVTSFGNEIDPSIMNSSILTNTLASGAQNINSQGHTIVRTFDGDFMIMGSFPNFEVDGNSRLEEMMIMRIAANGTKVDGKDQFFGLEAGNDQANKAIALPDGKIAVIGTFDFGSGIRLIGLMKLNINGELRN